MRLLLTAQAVFLAGCASVGASPLGELEASRGLCRASMESPALDPIRGKVPLPGSPATLAMMSSKDTPGDAERRALLELDRVARECAEGEARIYSAHWSASAAALIRQYYSDGSIARASLYSGDITFGEYTKGAERRWSNFQSTFSDLRMKERAVSAQEGQAAAAKAAAFQSIMPQQTSTTCTQYGNTVNCIKR